MLENVYIYNDEMQHTRFEERKKRNLTWLLSVQVLGTNYAEISYIVEV